jgi:hypothetical protein
MRLHGSTIGRWTESDGCLHMYTGAEATRVFNLNARSTIARGEVSLRSELDEIGVQHGTELSSLGRDHLRHWQPFLQTLRGEAFDLLEIGVGKGASLRTWRDWFSAARLIGLDVRRLILDPPIDNCLVLHGSQTDQATLRDLVRSYRFRLIVDDGSRHAEDKIETFLSLFPWLEPASVYICAGLNDPVFSFGADVDQPVGETSPVDTALGPAWFANLGRELAVERLVPPNDLKRLSIDTVLERATGVTLLRDCAVVTS